MSYKPVDNPIYLILLFYVASQRYLKYQVVTALELQHNKSTLIASSILYVNSDVS
jgi:hypothetical protein